MLCIVIIISILFTGITVYHLLRRRILKLILIPTISILYGIFLFFAAVGLGLSVFAFAAIPVIFAVIFMIRDFRRKA